MLSRLHEVKHYLLVILLGTIWSLVISLVITFISMLLIFGPGVIYTPFEGWEWIFKASVIPVILGSIILDRFYHYSQKKRSHRHLVALLVGYLTVVLTGSFGAIFAEYISYGNENVNVNGYIQWSWIYGMMILPISYPAALVFQYTMKKFRG